MKNRQGICSLFFMQCLIFAYTAGCGDVSTGTGTGTSSYPWPYTGKEVTRVKTGEKFTLKHPEWGFKDFDASTIYEVTQISQSGVQDKIDQASNAGGGTVLIPEGTVDVDTSGLALKSNVKLKGTLVDGKRMTIIRCTSSASGDPALIWAKWDVVNTTVEDMFIDGNGFKAHGILYAYGPDNILISNNEIINIHPDKNAICCWNSFTDYDPSTPYVCENITICNNYAHDGGMHRIDVRVCHSVLIYSNEGCDGHMGCDVSSRCRDVEVAGNYFYNNEFGGKMVSSNNVHWHHNDINGNQREAIGFFVIPESVSTTPDDPGAPANVWIEFNNLCDNDEDAFSVWEDSLPQLKHLVLAYNDVTGSYDVDPGGNHFNMLIYNAELVDVYGDSGVISNYNSTIVQH